MIAFLFPAAFSTQTKDARNRHHHGYLRIIPLSFENEVAECSDYQDLVKVGEGDGDDD